MSLPQDPTPKSLPKSSPIRDDLEKASYSTLLHRPSSDLAINLCASLLTGLVHHLQPRKPRQKQHDAFGAIVADMLRRDPADHGGWLYRSKRSESFTGEKIGLRPFEFLLEAMDGHMVEIRLGRRGFVNDKEAAKAGHVASQYATRFRATNWLRSWFENEGVTRDNWSEHFEPDPEAIALWQAKPKVSLVLRGEKPPYGNRDSKRPPLTIDRKDPRVSAMIRRMDKLNAYVSAQVVEPYGPLIHFYRSFADGSKVDHNWRQGGRLYAQGGGQSFQNAKKAARGSITINGLPTVELDLRASHLTILVGLGHLPLSCLEGDPYAVDGIPREVVKRWSTMTLGHGRRHGAWPKLATEELAKDGFDVETHYPIKGTGDAILAKLPLLGLDGRSVPVGWGELQFLESEIILSCMETLAFEHDVPALPVHDSLIVPMGSQGLSTRALEEAFHAQLGVTPMVEAWTGGDD